MLIRSIVDMFFNLFFSNISISRCPHCKRAFTRKDTFDLHIKSHLSLKLNCIQCSENFKDEKELKVHIERCHSNTVAGKSQMALTIFE